MKMKVLISRKYERDTRSQRKGFLYLLEVSDYNNRSIPLYIFTMQGETDIEPPNFLKRTDCGGWWKVATQKIIDIEKVKELKKWIRKQGKEKVEQKPFQEDQIVEMIKIIASHFDYEAVEEFLSSHPFLSKYLPVVWFMKRQKSFWIGNVFYGEGAREAEINIHTNYRRIVIPIPKLKRIELIDSEHYKTIQSKKRTYPKFHIQSTSNEYAIIVIEYENSYKIYDIPYFSSLISSCPCFEVAKRYNFTVEDLVQKRLGKIIFMSKHRVAPCNYDIPLATEKDLQNSDVKIHMNYAFSYRAIKLDEDEEACLLPVTNEGGL